MIYTSYYGNWRKWTGKGFVLCQVSNSKPKWFTESVIKIDPFIPSWSLVSGYKNGTVTEDQFKETYLKQLNNISEFGFYLPKDRNHLFLCHETPDQFCHRHILRGWINSKGVQCEEYV